MPCNYNIGVEKAVSSRVTISSLVAKMGLWSLECFHVNWGFGSLKVFLLLRLVPKRKSICLSACVERRETKTDQPPSIPLFDLFELQANKLVFFRVPCGRLAKLVSLSAQQLRDIMTLFFPKSPLFGYADKERCLCWIWGFSWQRADQRPSIDEEDAVVLVFDIPFRMTQRFSDNLLFGKD